MTLDHSTLDHSSRSLSLLGHNHLASNVLTQRGRVDVMDDLDSLAHQLPLCNYAALASNRLV